MKNLKYLQVFEAFESETLTKVFNYVNSKQKGHFKTILSDLCDKLNFPMSDLSDDLFQYLSFNKALQLTANIEDQPCDNESDTITGEVCSGPTGDAEQGTIMRTWGRGRRRVECPVCKGTGIKPKTSFPIKWIKFWFDKDGKYVTATITDGQIRDQDTSYGGGKLDTDLDNYERAEKVRWDELSNYNQGDFFLFSDGSSNGTGVAMLWKSGGQNFMLQNFASGSEPSSSEWRKVARYSWVVTSSGDLRSLIKLNPKKAVEDNQSEVKKPDPYSWNALVNLRNLSVQRSSKVKEELQPAHFALVLDYVKMKEKTKESTFKDTQFTKQQRTKSRIDAEALKTDAEIKSANFDRYIDKISKNLADKFQVKPGESVDEKSSYLKLIFLRIFGYGYAGHYVLQGLNFSDFKTIKDYIFNALLYQDKYALERAVSSIESKMSTNKRYNTNMKNNLDYLVENCPDEEFSEKDDEGNVIKTYTRMDIIKKLMEVNRVIVYKINNSNLECLQDVDILFDKLKNIRENFRNNPAYEKCLQASNVNYYLEDGNLRQPLRYLNEIEVYNIPGIIKNFDSLIKYINRA
jgi:hypothetical protein